MKVLVALFALALAGAVLLALLSSPADAATTFTINKTGDAKDRKINGVCDSSLKRGKQCTLRAAIQEANATAAADTINFNIGGTTSVKTISPASPLPEIINPVTINGYTQRGASENTLAQGNDAILKVQLNGTNAGTDAIPNPDGLAISASNSTIKGLVINSFGGSGLEINSGATGNKVEGNYIGTTASGSGDLGNGGQGVLIDSASDNSVGGTEPRAANAISGNGGSGVLVNGSGVTGNSVLSNSIFSNDGLGIDLNNDGVTNNDPDDPDTGANNLQNSPVITSATRDSTTGTTTITGTLNSNPAQTYTIQCFKSDGASTGYGEGQTLLDTTTTTTDAGGDSPAFTCTSNTLAVDDRVSMTATNTSGTANLTRIGDSSEFSQNVTVTSSDDRPVISSGGTLSYIENDPPTPVDDSLSVTHPQNSQITQATVQITANYQNQNGEDALAFTDNNASDGITQSGSFDSDTGKLTLTGSGSAAEYQAALRVVTYENQGESPSTATRTVTFLATDANSATSSPASRSISVTSVNDAPVADDETFNGNSGAIGNTTLVVNDPDDGAPSPSHPKKTITGDILAGDTDTDGPLTVTPGTFPTNDGGSVTIESDGDFTFDPAASTSCTDTSDFFDYTVEDSGSPILTDTGRVTISIAGCVWYVSNNAAGNSGTSSAPFDALAQAEAASGTDHTVFVLDGDNTSTGYGGDGYALDPGERLIGEHEGLVVDPDQGGALGSDTLQPANAGAHPTLTATSADVIDLDDGNEVRGFNIDPQGTGGGIAGSAGDTGGTIDDVNIVDNGTAGTQPGLELASTTGTFNISNLAIDSSLATSPPATAIGVRLASAGTVNFAPASDITIKTKGASALDAFGTGPLPTNLGTSAFDAITVTDSSAGGVKMTGTTGTTTFGDGVATDLDLTTTSGTDAAFSLNSAGTVSVDTAGNDVVRATGGPAISVAGTTIGAAGLKFDDIDSTNSTTNGISLSGLGNGEFFATSGDISGAAGASFGVSGGSGNVTYLGNLNDGNGQAASISGRTNGTVLLSGQVNDDNDQGGGIRVSSNTGGTTTFSNATKRIDTTANGGNQDAVVMMDSDGHTLNFTGGGFDIDTGSGRGIEATNSGTLNVTGFGNTIDTGSGKALNVTNTDTGATPLTFQRISSDGANGGIVLNNTGSNNVLTVTGNGSTVQGGNASGGTIQNTTGDAVSLTDTVNPSFNNVTINNAGDAGVKGFDRGSGAGADGVQGFSFTNGTISNAGQTAPLQNYHAALAFNQASVPSTDDNLTGVATITNNVISSPYGGGVSIVNYRGTISNANISNNSIRSTESTTTSKEDGISLLTNGADDGSLQAASLTRATISNNNIVGFPSGYGIEAAGGNVASSTVTDYGIPDSFPNGNVGENIVNISNNLIRGHSTAIPMNGDAILAKVDGKGRGNFNITSNGTAANPITNTAAQPLATRATGDVDVDIHMSNNFVNSTAPAGTPATSVAVSERNVGGGVGIVDGFVVNASVVNNTVSASTGAGFSGAWTNSNGTVNMKVASNNFASPSTANISGININQGSSSSPPKTMNMCLDITGNVAGAGPPSGFQVPGISVREFQNGPGGHFRLAGLIPPSGATNAQAEALMSNNNPGSMQGDASFNNQRAAVWEGTVGESCPALGF